MRGSWPLSWLAYDKGNTNRERKVVDSMSQEMIKAAAISLLTFYMLALLVIL